MSDLIRREDAIALTQRAIDGYGQKMRDAAVKAEKRDWQSMLFAAVDIDAAIRALPAAQPDPREAALRDIARQKKSDEMDTEYDVEYAEFEGGYNAIIDVARRALRAVQPDAREAALREALEAVNAKWRSGADTPDEVRGLALAEAAILDLIEGQQP